MTAQWMDGKAVAGRVREQLAPRIAALRVRLGRPPCLAVVLVGDDSASQVYVRNKQRACAEAGIESRRVDCDASTSSAELARIVAQLNRDEGVDGLLVQLPLPRPIDASAVREWIEPCKDVDGLHPINAGLLMSGTPRMVPCTPAGCLELLRAYDVPTAGRRAVVIGRSLIVGRPMANLLSLPGIDATVTICHSRTRDLAAVCREADILVAAAGQPQLLRAEHVAAGAIVLDVGIHRIEDPTAKSGSRLVGDVHPEVAERARLISPVPGGVGPMTIAMLLSNTVRAAEGRLSA
jgi:methylenetetrahydrofolate dehydrogenase (NADP+)/methenyltetrahydrofolate cyclohydrolase